MITKEELRQAALLAGGTQEQADAYCEWFFGPNGFLWSIDQMAAALELIKLAFAQSSQIIAEFLENLAQCPAYDNQPRNGRRRPPRYAGPQNKGRPWTIQPTRVARSSCRRYRR